MMEVLARTAEPGPLPGHLAGRAAEIFLDQLDRDAWVRLLGDVDATGGGSMPGSIDNHFHLVVETTQPELSAGLQRLNGLYAQRFNRRYDRVGHLFRVASTRVIEDDEHFENTPAYSSATRSAAAAQLALARRARSQLRRFNSPRACWFQGTRCVVPAAPTASRLARYQSYVSISVCAFESRGSQPSSPPPSRSRRRSPGGGL